MIRSMTGYGRGQCQSQTVALTVEIRSVNHRYGDITVKAPRALLPFENDIKKRVAERLKRGKIDVFITQEAIGAAAVLPTLNRPLAEAYLTLFAELARDYPVEDKFPLELLVTQKDVISLREGEVPEAELSESLQAALGQALDRLERMRMAEGEATLQDIGQRLQVVEDLLRQIDERASRVPREWQARLRERLSRLAPDLDFDPQRVAQEIAIFADRCDISEELTRFRSHLQQFTGLYAAAEPVRRQMDFLLQELNREANTTGSKSNDPELTGLVVNLKAELEKVREQVQNVE
jgi:uncharacterized protein (TIGR00255 family)